MVGALVGALVAGVLLAACTAPGESEVPGSLDHSLAPPGLVAYALCPTEITPVEVRTGVAEPAIPLHLPTTPALGTYAIATSTDGTMAYVATVPGSSRAQGAHAEIIPVDLVRQVALAPIALPLLGVTRAIITLPTASMVAVAVGSDVLIVDVATGKVVSQADLGLGHNIYAIVNDPARHVLFAMVTGSVVPIPLSGTTFGVPRSSFPTDLAVSSVTSGNGMTMAPNGAALLVVGQFGTNYAGHVIALSTATGATLGTVDLSVYGFSSPAAVAVTSQGQVAVADASRNWMVPVTLAASGAPTTPGPVAIPGDDAVEHPSDVVPAGTSASFELVAPQGVMLSFDPTTHAYGKPVAVCTGATSVAVAPSP